MLKFVKIVLAFPPVNAINRPSECAIVEVFCMSESRAIPCCFVAVEKIILRYTVYEIGIAPTKIGHNYSKSK